MSSFRLSGPVAAAVAALVGYAAYVQSPRNPLRPTALPDGVGPVTHRRYWVEVRAPDVAPEVLTAEVLQRLPELAPRFAAWFRGLDAPLPSQGGPPIGPGTRLRILMGFIRRARVTVEKHEPRRFCIRTLRLHADAGTVTFCAEPTSGGLHLEIESVVRSSSWFDRFSYLAGAHALQRANWEAVLRGAAALSGGEVTGHGHRTEEHAFVPPGGRYAVAHD
ncbi:hypothetical protein LAJ19_02275 [Deinococcus taeanensis]|uniref:hypothetical protein n=1 Tax=Deinococcus taeanensis TaxID=2737050 RepID=UPI001CDB98E9|nr:hypothetical protein [Deinococcus taeanensis]UBV43072.1 hypothetical protein LAJ19_02275 [Deinococcus taeanensis]